MTDFAANGDVRIAYEVHGEGPALLLIHGLGYGRWGWAPVLEPLASRFRVIVFDNRGMGESDKPAGPYTAAELADDAAAVLDAAGQREAHVVGTSLGGMVAQELALVHPKRVANLVLACTTPGGERAFPYPEPTQRLFAEAASLDPALALRRFVENALAPGAPRELVNRIFELRLSNPPDPVGWQAQAGAAQAFDANGRLAAIASPTLVVHGTEDQVVDVRNAQLLAEAIPNARVELVPGAGHLLFWEQPERFVELVTEFVG